MSSANRGGRAQRYRAGHNPNGPESTPQSSSHATTSYTDHQTHEEAGKSTLDRRLERLAQTSSSEPSGERVRRRVHRAEVVVSSDEPAEPESSQFDSTNGGRRPNNAMTFDSVKAPASRTPAAVAGEDMEMDEEDVDDRRSRLRSLLLERQAERLSSEPVDRALGGSRGGGISGLEENVDEEYDSEEEEDEEDEEEETVTIRPVFVKKSQRATLKDEDTLQKEQAEEKAREEAAEALRREQTKEMIATEEAREDEAKLDLVDGVIEDIEKLDDPDKEYELWRIRELNRLKRDKEAEGKLESEREGVDEKKDWSDEKVMRERKAAEREARERGEISEDSKQFSQRKTMQRYYHKGAFFQDEMAKLSKTHDWDAPTGEDNWFNRSSDLDSVKFKKYGAAKSVKSSSLKDQDTSVRPNSPPHYSQNDRKRPSDRDGRYDDYHRREEHRDRRRDEERRDDRGRRDERNADDNKRYDY